MRVPTDFCSGRKPGVSSREQIGGEAGGEVGVDEVIDAECREDFVDVKWESAKGEGVG